MKYLVIGSGGREHCLAWRLLDDGSAAEVYVAPGNGGIEDRFRLDVNISNFPALEHACIDKNIDVVVVGPEAPLVDGVVDYLTEKKIPAFGPTKKAAMLEGSKLFAKQIMEKYGVPTAGHRDFTGQDSVLRHLKTVKEFPIVIKLDGLAAGKGVCVAANPDEALEFVLSSAKEDGKIFLEDYIFGEEASVLGISDGDHVETFIAAQDHKRAYDGDTGPNTGGMGAYAPAPIIDAAKLRRVRDEVLIPTVRGMKAEGIPFKGILYAGVILQGDDIKVLEFNARFGDPETQVLLPLMKNRLGDIIGASINGTLSRHSLKFERRHAITVVMASGGYPGDYPKGKPVKGLGDVSDRILVFHAGTKTENGAIVTNGGRVLNITAAADTLEEARERVYGEIDVITFEGSFYRKDIAHRALKRPMSSK